MALAPYIDSQATLVDRDRRNSDLIQKYTRTPQAMSLDVFSIEILLVYRLFSARQEFHTPVEGSSLSLAYA